MVSMYPCSVEKRKKMPGNSLNTVNMEFVENEKLSGSQTDAIQRLRSAVYPPEVLASLPGIRFSWASPQWSVLIWEGKEVIAKAGLLVRDVISNGVSKRIGGIGGVMTHPAEQGRGLSSQAMREASSRFNDELDVSFALLFCRPHLVPFYKRLLWKPFEGKVFVEQPEGSIDFTANGAMVLDVKEQAPLNGTIDLNGLPW